MADEKVYSPAEIADTPLPQAVSDPTMVVSQPAQPNLMTPKSILDQPFPIPSVSDETIGNSLNTKSKKILADFNFTKGGAFTIGDFQQDVSGDIKISPNGIIARNKNGDNTLAIDGDTGDAVFAGEVKAKDFTIVDQGGLVSLSAFNSYQFFHNAALDVTSDTFADVANSEIDLVLERAIHIMLSISCNISFIPNTSDVWGGVLGLSLDGVDTPDIYVTLTSQTAIGAYDTIQSTCAQTSIFALDRGSHVLKLRVASLTNTKKVTFSKIIMNILTLGQ